MFGKKHAAQLGRTGRQTASLVLQALVFRVRLPPVRGKPLDGEMIEGWAQDRHFIVFTDEEAASAATRYGLRDSLPGYTVVGLLGWDDFIVRSSSGDLFTVPTVPAVGEYLEPFHDELPHQLRGGRAEVGADPRINFLSRDHRLSNEFRQIGLVDFHAEGAADGSTIDQITQDPISVPAQ